MRIGNYRWFVYSLILLTLSRICLSLTPPLFFMSAFKTQRWWLSDALSCFAFWETKKFFRKDKCRQDDVIFLHGWAFYTLWWCFLIHINGVTSKSWRRRVIFHRAVCEWLHAVFGYEVHLVTQWFRLRDERRGGNVCICANCVLSFHGRIVTFQQPHPVTSSFPWNGSKS